MKHYAIDLDGTLAYYDKFDGKDIIGKPIQKMVDLVKKFIENGDKITIFTARASDEKAIKVIKEWCKEHIGKDELDVTNIKLSSFDLFYDDKAITVEKNTGVILSKPKEDKELNESIEENKSVLNTLGIINNLDLI
jgi:hypothetical protein